MLYIEHLGLRSYIETWDAMRQFTETRDAHTDDRLWLLEHPPVFTQGQAGKPEHILQSSDIPVVQSDRGGQVTYHGPGQLVGYVLLDLTRLKIGIRTLVCTLERLLITTLQHFGIAAQTKLGAPGVYVGDRKIASIGLRVKKGCTYHGFALNVDMDLTPFSYINPCGYAQLEMVNMVDIGAAVTMEKVVEQLKQQFQVHFGTGVKNA
ncbi:MAG: lipoyl(octanoyl) transferase LipB [Legionellaceae bacterium]|nr:lipoyl(octanoyl) transferase LipB [Legionellaceae bacterium]